MAPANSKANYKTYEAQARMVRAIVAAHPDVKWNYKGKSISNPPQTLPILPPSPALSLKPISFPPSLSRAVSCSTIQPGTKANPSSQKSSHVMART